MINSYLKIEKKRDEKGRKYIETKLILTVEERKWGSDMVMIETAGEECGDWRELEKWKVKTRERERERERERSKFFILSLSGCFLFCM